MPSRICTPLPAPTPAHIAAVSFTLHNRASGLTTAAVQAITGLGRGATRAALRAAATYHRHSGRWTLKEKP